MENINEIQQPFSTPRYYRYYRYYRYTKEQIANLINILCYHMYNVEQEICKLKSLISDFNEHKNYEEISKFLRRYCLSSDLRYIDNSFKNALIELKNVKQLYYLLCNKNEDDLYIHEFIITNIANTLSSMHNTCKHGDSECEYLDDDCNSITQRSIVGQIILGVRNIDYSSGFRGYEKCAINDRNIIINDKEIDKSKVINQRCDIIDTFSNLESNVLEANICLTNIPDSLIIIDNLEIIRKLIADRNECFKGMFIQELLTVKYNIISEEILKGLNMRAIFNHTDISEINKVLSTEYCSQPCCKALSEAMKDIINTFIFVDEDNDSGNYKFYICEIY